MCYIHGALKWKGGREERKGEREEGGEGKE